MNLQNPFAAGPSRVIGTMSSGYILLIIKSILSGRPAADDSATDFLALAKSSLTCQQLTDDSATALFTAKISYLKFFLIFFLHSSHFYVTPPTTSGSDAEELMVGSSEKFAPKTKRFMKDDSKRGCCTKRGRGAIKE